MSKTIRVKELDISLFARDNEEYISMTDMCRFRPADRPDHIIQNWMRTRSTIEFLGLWEQLSNPIFKPLEFEGFKNEAGSNSFTLTPKKWIETTNAIGVVSKSGRYGGTFAHKDIAFEFATWLSPVFKLYLIKEYQRLKEIETNQYNLDWNVKRILTKTNFLLHTDAIKNHILPTSNYTKQTEWLAYAEEADLLNVAVFGFTAKQWREANPSLANQGNNARDFASINELAVLSNLESHNAEMIKLLVSKQERFERLRAIAQYQLQILNENDFMKSLKRSSLDFYLSENDQPLPL